jgi:hypothetical protein
MVKAHSRGVVVIRASGALQPKRGIKLGDSRAAFLTSRTREAAARPSQRAPLIV